MKDHLPVVGPGHDNEVVKLKVDLDAVVRHLLKVQGIAKCEPAVFIVYPSEDEVLHVF